MCAVPEVRAKVAELTEKFRDEKDPRDSQLRLQAFTLIAEAFEAAGLDDEAAKWRERAAAERAKLDFK